MKNIILILSSFILLISCNKTNVNSCCTGTAQIAAVDSAVIAVPDIFTPNGDGRNDILYLRAKNISSANFSISSTTGKVFETNDFALGWDGRYKGKPIKEKSYSFTVDAVSTSGKTLSLKGNICLIRDNCVNGQLINCFFDSQFNGNIFDNNIPSGESIKACN